MHCALGLLHAPPKKDHRPFGLLNTKTVGAKLHKHTKIAVCSETDNTTSPNLIYSQHPATLLFCSPLFSKCMYKSE